MVRTPLLFERFPGLLQHGYTLNFCALFTERYDDFRAKMGRKYVRHRLRCREFTVVSDDCWGGRVYSEFAVKCCSPFAGIGIHPHEYLDFICGLREPNALDVLAVSTHTKGYPLLHTRNAVLHALHHRSTGQLRHIYERRVPLITWDKIFIKIDLGKPKYRTEDIERWNALKLPNSIAFYRDVPGFRDLKIHNGVVLPEWSIDGHKQFNISCRSFDIFDWINHGVVRSPLGYRCMQQLLLEKFPAKRIQGSYRRRRDALFA
jgi:uncharacterized protein (DUF1919 family)